MKRYIQAVISKNGVDKILIIENGVTEVLDPFEARQLINQLEDALEDCKELREIIEED